ncbi:hypothetical protein DEO72_LG8g257 [Vigna unguiculata]|uniref:Uncharacterized protein n=1 Tax=Vigna unguiculata TaxID=3917 RepID=A0A4D6MLA6_VIGUN|nr:hypothetical protein DEO72_LG8g257 [Vigna unguiculata]
MELKEDPGPIDNYVLYDQDNHVSSAVWDGHCWSYSRLNVGLPKFNQEPDTNCFPFVLKWKGKSGCRTKCNVVSYRKALDSLNPCDVTAMREIASIADIVSAEGLDSYNRELLDEVKNIVHKCLTEQYEEMPNDKVKKKGNRKRRQKDHLSMEYE